MTAATQLSQLLDGIDVSYVGCGPETPVDRVTAEEGDAGPHDTLIALPVPCDQLYKREYAVAHGDVVITDRTVALQEGQRAVYIERPERGFGVLAERLFDYPGHKLKMAAVTGTNGKTTTSWLVASILAHAGKAHTRIGTVGHSVVGQRRSDEFTTPPPFPLQEMLAHTVASGARYAVMEASSQGLVEGRVWPLKLDAVAMTNLGSDHLDLHQTLEAYRSAKLLLASQHLKPGGVAVAVVDDEPTCETFLEIARSQGATAWAISVKTGRKADIQVLRELEPNRPGRWAVEVATPAGTFDLSLSLEGRFNLTNALTAAGLALGLGLSLDEISAGLAQAGPAPGRVQWVSEPGPDRIGVMVDSAQCPHSLAHILPVARERTHGALRVVTGCGGDRDRVKRPVVGRLVARHADHFYATCNNIRHEDPRVILRDTLSELTAEDLERVTPDVDRRASIERAVAEANPGDVVLIAGLGGQDYVVIGADRVPLDEGAIARAVLARR